MNPYTILKIPVSNICKRLLTKHLLSSQLLSGILLQHLPNKALCIIRNLRPRFPLKINHPLKIAKATPCSVSTKRAKNKKANNFIIKSNNYRHTHNSRTTKYLPKMEELHIEKYKESLQHSIYPLQAYNFASIPQAPYSTNSPQSLRTLHLRPTKP